MFVPLRSCTPNAWGLLNYEDITGQLSLSLSLVFAYHLNSFENEVVSHGCSPALRMCCVYGGGQHMELAVCHISHSIRIKTHMAPLG